MEEQIDRSNLRSPINGVVTQLFVRDGEMLGSAAAVASIGVFSTMSKPTNTVMTLAQNGILQLYADVNEADFAGIYRIGAGHLETGKIMPVDLLRRLFLRHRRPWFW